MPARPHRLAAFALGLLAPPAPAAPPGWTTGEVAAGTPAALAPSSPVVVGIPAELAARIQAPTALFYFAPTCPHCVHVTPEVDALAKKGPLAWVGVASGSASAGQVERYRQELGVSFDVWIDRDHAFADAVGARQTPNVYVARPAPAGAVVENGVPVEFVDAYAPFGPGTGAILVMRSHPDSPFREFQGYQGERVCGACHTNEARSMAISFHAMSLRSLWERKRETELGCLACHVTGLGQPGGYEPGRPASPLGSVTCEACHGPAGPHDGERTDARATCPACHDSRHSIAFDLDRALPHVDHFAAAGLGEAEVLERVQDLLEGVAERPLLAFPDGPTAGAEACRACHKAEHRWWRKDGHARAGSLLQEDEGERAECVRCHATPPAVGGGAANGVGCESCHGPAAAHAASPSAARVVGLRDAEPACIVEGICTGCHTERWDPDWDLDERLRAIAH